MIYDLFSFPCRYFRSGSIDRPSKSYCFIESSVFVELHPHLAPPTDHSGLLCLLSDYRLGNRVTQIDDWKGNKSSVIGDIEQFRGDYLCYTYLKHMFLALYSEIIVKYRRLGSLQPKISSQRLYHYTRPVNVLLYTLIIAEKKKHKGIIWHIKGENCVRPYSSSTFPRKIGFLDSP